ncbi:MAG: alpha/beta hydrolase [Roseobacter sp.]|jgi:pimeloyl-ACP methyl ester carboxylesterase|nr:alpha/beta hydrolase [Roseobacter sp.]
MPLVAKASIILLLLVLVLVALVQWRAAAREASVEAEFPASGRYIDVKGTQIHVNIAGQGPDIILIHGASGSLRDFTFHLMPKLAESYRVIAVDRPGMGRSERPEGYGGVFNLAAEPPALQAQLLQAATDQLSVTNPIVLGHSYGGAIALAWALERPDTTAGLVLLGAASNPWPGSLGFLYRMNTTLFGSAVAIPLITAFTPHVVIQNTLSEIFAPQQPPEGYMDHFGPDMTLRRSTMRANAQQVNGLKPHIYGMSARYETLTLPVEILHGTEDNTVPMHIHSIPLERQLPNATLTKMRGVGHMPHHADPDAVVAAVDRLAARADLR